MGRTKVFTSGGFVFIWGEQPFLADSHLHLLPERTPGYLGGKVYNEAAFKALVFQKHGGVAGKGAGGQPTLPPGLMWSPPCRSLHPFRVPCRGSSPARGILGLFRCLCHPGLGSDGKPRGLECQDNLFSGPQFPHLWP